MTNNTPENKANDWEPSLATLTNVKVMAAVFACYFFTSYRMGEDARTVGVIALLSVLVAKPRWVVSPWPWIGVLGSLLYTLWQRPLDVPNHHFMVSYVAMALVLSLSAPARSHATLLQRNARWLLIVLMGFATLQKAVSPTFLDGSYLGYEIARGGFGDPVLPLFGGISDTAATNDKLITEFRATPPWEQESIQLHPLTPYSGMVAKAFMVSILAIELLLFLGFLLMPRALLSHALLLSFILTLGVLRQEFTFISVVAAMGLWACCEQQRGLRAAYAVLAVFCAAAVLKTLN